MARVFDVEGVVRGFGKLDRLTACPRSIQRVRLLRPDPLVYDLFTYGQSYPISFLARE